MPAVLTKTRSAVLALSVMLMPDLASAQDQGGGGFPSRMSLETSADAGDPFASFVAGRRYLIASANGSDDRLREKGLDYIAAAVDAGFAPAARFAGSMYLEGELLPRNTELAMDWFSRAADLGDVSAQVALGDIYYNGQVVKQDLARAVFWYESALAAASISDSETRMWEVATRLGHLYASVDSGLPQDWARARVLWQDVATQMGYPPAIKALAHAQANGLGGEQDTKAAINSYLQAASAYRESGLRFAIHFDDARHEVAGIVEQMVRLKAKHKYVKRAREEMARISQAHG